MTPAAENKTTFVTLRVLLAISDPFHFNSPIQLLIAFFNGRLQSFAYGFSHSRDRGKVQRFLDGTPIFFRNEHRGVAFACDLDWPVRLGDIVQETVESFPGF
jgi:hypothetical protein